jgi:hypothetical protein
MDLYKVVILVSLLLLPGMGWMIKQTQDSIVEANKELRLATRKDGLLSEIGELRQQIQTVENNRVSGSGAEQYKVYFERQITNAAPPGALSGSDFTVSNAKPVNAVTSGSTKQRAQDHVVGIDFRKDFKLTWEFLFALLFNSESAAQGAGGRALPSIWKLRKLNIQNATFAEVRSGNTPPLPFQDAWLIRPRGLEFARREPTK